MKISEHQIIEAPRASPIEKAFTPFTPSALARQAGTGQAMALGKGKGKAGTG